MSDPSAKITARMVKGLGGASLGLGLTEILAPGKVASLAGIDDTGRSGPVIRALGLRECAHAAALLFGPNKMVWTRVAGDVLDVTLLAAALAKSNHGRRRQRGTVSMVALAAIGAADFYAALRTTGGGGRHANGSAHRSLRAAVTVRRPQEDVYRFWRDLENLPSFMQHLQSVTESGDRSHWVTDAPLGQSVQWDAQVTDDEPNKRIAWQSLPGAAIENGGSVEFSPAPDDGTEVRVTMSYRLPGGVLGKATATAFGESPEQQVNDDLRRFKQLMETGQVIRSDGSPEGTAAGRQMHQHVAAPASGEKGADR